ncbi:MAG: VOC family protein [Acidimicrobiales bacterium]|nr:VOC family protein [Acidimicrobiales bacterium]
MDDKLTTCLWFPNRDGLDAAQFYAKTFPDSEVLDAMHASTDYPGGSAGDVLAVNFTVLGRPFMALNSRPEISPNHSVSFIVITEDQDETDRYWNAIIDNGGEADECGWCRDRWGFSWQITPRILLEGMQHSDPLTAQRVMTAMMTMVKIDVAQIEAALAG